MTTAEDRILRKKVFHRQTDLQDVKGILHVQRGRLDLPYLRHWSSEMLEPVAAQELEQLIVTYLAPGLWRAKVRPSGLCAGHTR